MNIEQLDHIQGLPTRCTRASCHINIDAHNSDQLEAVYNLSRGQIRVSDFSFKVQAKRLWEWIQFIRSHLGRFGELRQLPGTLKLERPNEGCVIEPAMVTNNALHHQACKLKYNNTKLQRAEKQIFMTEVEINDAPGACKRTRFHSK